MIQNKAIDYLETHPGATVEEVAKGTRRSLRKTAKELVRLTSPPHRAPNEALLDRRYRTLIARLEGVSISKIAKSLGVPRHTITNDLATLKSLGLLPKSEAQGEVCRASGASIGIKRTEALYGAKEPAAYRHITTVWCAMLEELREMPEALTSEGGEDVVIGSVGAYLHLCEKLGWTVMASWFEAAIEVTNG